MDKDVDTWIGEMRRVGLVSTPLETMLAEDIYTYMRAFDELHLLYDVDGVWSAVLRNYGLPRDIVESTKGGMNGWLLEGYGLPPDFYTWVRIIFASARVDLDIKKLRGYQNAMLRVWKTY